MVCIDGSGRSVGAIPLIRSTKNEMTGEASTPAISLRRSQSGQRLGGSADSASSASRPCSAGVSVVVADRTWVRTGTGEEYRKKKNLKNQSVGVCGRQMASYTASMVLGTRVLT